MSGSSYQSILIHIIGRIRYFTNQDKYPPGYNVQEYDFDWFNFAGKTLLIRRR